MSNLVRQSSPYNASYKEAQLQTPNKSNVYSSPQTTKKETSFPDYETHDQTKQRLHETHVHKSIVEQENNNLKQDVEFWQGKVGHAENEKHLQLELKDQTHRSQVEVLKRTHENQLSLHETEIKRLKDHIHEREDRISELAAELKAKLEECDRLKLDNGAKDAELFRAQREINDLKQIADFKTGENEKLRADKSELQLQLYQSQQSEAALKDNEQKLYGQIAALRDTLAKQDEDNKNAHAIKDANHSNQVQALHQQHTNEKDVLNGEIAKHCNTINAQNIEKADLQNRLGATINDLNNSVKNHQNAEACSKLWQDKHSQSEQDKAIQLEQARQLRDATVDRLSRNHSIEQAGLQNRINSLNSALVNKDSELNNTKSAWAATENNKKNLELAKATLEVQLKDWMRKKDEADKNYQSQIKIQNDLHNNAMKNTIAQGQRDKELLGNQINGLRSVVDQKHKELNDARTNSHLNHLRAEENNKRFRDASSEAELWRNQADKIHREKSAEVEAAHSLRNSQVAGLQKDHANQLVKQEQEKEALRGVIGQKHNEIVQHQGQIANLSNVVAQKHTEAESHKNSALAWQSKHDSEQALRNQIANEAETHKSQLRNIIVDKEREANDLKQSQVRLQSDLYNTQQHANRQSAEANLWKQQHDQEQQKRSIDRGIQEELHRQNAQKMKDSHEAEKQHLHGHIQDLHGHVQKKNQEAADWRRSYHQTRYGNK